MRLRPLFALAVSAAAAVWMPAWAQAVPAASETTAPARDVRGWLMRIHDAARQRNFQGTFVVSSGGAVSSSRIAHFCTGGNQIERIDSLDGQPRHVFRQNDVVQTVWPASRVAIVEKSQSLMAFPALLQSGDDHIADFYDLRAEGSARVAGHDANVLVVLPKDGLRYGYRLWSERTTGLLLRAEVLGEHSEVLETSAFSEVSIGVRPQPDLVLQAMKKLDGLRVLRPVLAPTSLEAEGWNLRQAVPGFRQASCVRRSMSAGGEGEAGADASQALQAIFSDGLTHVSVFIEPFDVRRHTRPMLAAVGATQTLMKRQGEWWITVVGDVPAATLRQFAGALERRK